MLNYYEILGLKSGADAKEIKSAFRRLAKLYHPDKNPEGKDHFSKLLKAYETLINPETRLRYDHKLEYEQSQKQGGHSETTKKYRNYEAEELKRRKYYEEHIKKYEKKKAAVADVPEVKESYNEFKYILFATPLAVLLFLLIANLAKNDNSSSSSNGNRINKSAALTLEKPTEDKTAELSDLFGENKYFENSSGAIEIKNPSEQEAIVCLFNYNKEFIRLVKIPALNLILVDKLPKAKLLLTYCFKNSVHSENFSEKDFFYKSMEFKYPETINPLTLQLKSPKGFIKISKEEFLEFSK